MQEAQKAASMDLYPHSTQGVYFSFWKEYELLIGWGEKYDVLLRKKREYKGEEVETRGGKGNFHNTGKKYYFRK